MHPDLNNLKIELQVDRNKYGVWLKVRLVYVELLHPEKKTVISESEVQING